MFDLSPQCLALARQKAKEQGVQITDFVEGTAIDLSRFSNASFDAVLCMGPLYHLIEEQDRITAIRECLRVLEPGGIFFGSFISGYAPLLDLFRKSPEEITDKKDRYQKYIDGGLNIESPANEGFTDALFITPNDIPTFMSQFALKQCAIYGLESILGAAHPRLNEMPDEVRAAWLDTMFSFAERPETWGSSDHLLYIGKKVRRQGSAKKQK